MGSLIYILEGVNQVFLSIPINIFKILEVLPQLLKTKFGSPDLYLFCFLRSLLDQGTKENESCVNTPLEKKKALNQGLNLLTEEEKEREASVRAAQLSSIFKLMQSQPDRFGDMSIEDMSDQFQKFYVRHCED